MAVRIRILGPFEVAVDDSPLRLGRPHRRSILALLALRANDIVPFGEIVDALWQDRPPSRARNQVHVYISGLRYQLDHAGLGRGILQTHHVGYRLAVPAGARDIDRLETHVAIARRLLGTGELDRAAEHLRLALNLFRGRPLDGVEADFARWEATLLQERRLALVTDYAKAEIARRRPEAVLAELFRCVRAHPTHEALRGQLMLALYWSGRPADALTVYREGRQVLVDELGVEPGPLLRQAQATILRGESLNVAH
jgi:DNA-binding SARP family transcriptional activator